MPARNLRRQNGGTRTDVRFRNGDLGVADANEGVITAKSGDPPQQGNAMKPKKRKKRDWAPPPKCYRAPK